MAQLSDGAKISGMLALVILGAIRRQDLMLLRETCREIAEQAEEDARWIFATVGTDLSPSEAAWWAGAIARIQSGEGVSDE